jgi:hypothetical protein
VFLLTRARVPRSTGGRVLPPMGFYRFRLPPASRFPGDGGGNRRDFVVVGTGSGPETGDSPDGNRQGISQWSRRERTAVATAGQPETPAGARRARRCGLCIANAAEATHFCHTCGEPLCDECANMHARYELMSRGSRNFVWRHSRRENMPSCAKRKERAGVCRL